MLLSEQFRREPFYNSEQTSRLVTSKKQTWLIAIAVDRKNPLKITFFAFIVHEKYVRLCISLSVRLFGDPIKPCTCAPSTVTKYQKRISGPLLDRIDIHVEVPRVDYEKLSGNRAGEMSETIRARVQAARDIQNKRFSCHGASDIVCNADMRVGEIRQFCRLQDEGQSLMRAAMSQLNLSARGYHRILKLARTIADLVGSEEIQSTHLAEALQYRPKM